MKDAHKFAEKLVTCVNLATPDPSFSSQQVPKKRINRYQVSQHLKKKLCKRSLRKWWKTRDGKASAVD